MILIVLIAVFGVILVFASKMLYELRNKVNNLPFLRCWTMLTSLVSESQQLH